jgi:predicted alpha/beta superfamily hydrolase
MKTSIDSPRARILALTILLFYVLSACTTQTPEPSNLPSTLVPILHSELRQLNSSATGRSYDIYIRLPDNYAQDQTKNYPVLYVLDGQWDFKLLDSIYGGLLYDGFIPEMIIVGITYSGEDADYGALRAMDYTPVHELYFTGSGDAPKFHEFLKDELIPFMETNYRTDSSRRLLMGSSFGGTFTLYAMFTDPTLFSGYVASSPIVVYGDRFAFQQEAAYAASHMDLPVKLFVSVGELEDIVYPVKEFTQILDERNYTGLEMELRIIEGEGHASNKPESYNRGLRFVLSK